MARHIRTSTDPMSSLLPSEYTCPSTHSSSSSLQLSMDTNVEDTLTGHVTLVSKSSVIDGKIPAADDLVKLVAEGAQSVADIDELLEAALKSFETIAQWFAATSTCV